MRIKSLFNHVFVGLMVSGIVAIAPGGLAQTVPLPKPEVEHLTCVQDPQGLMCKADDRDSQSVAAEVAASHPIISSERLGHLSDLLLACIYFVLPAGLGLAIFLSDKRSELLRKQIDRLEKLWSQTPQ